MKLTFERVMELLNDGRSVKQHDVKAEVLRRKLWYAEWHFPGCIAETFSLCLTKEDAISTALDFARDADDYAPYGMRTALKRDGIFYGKAYGATCVTTIGTTTVGERCS